MPDDDYFLKIDGIPGESLDPKHKDEIEVISFGWGLTNSASQVGGAGSGTGRPEFKDFSFTMLVNEASPQLFLACASGKHLRSAILTARRSGKGQFEYLTIRFADVVMTAFEETGGEDAPEEAASLSYRQVQVEYRQQSPQGTPGPAFKAGWDLSRNQEI